MRLNRKVLALGVSAAGAVLLAGAGTASAAFPNYTDCPRRSVNTCIDIQAVSGSMAIKSTRVPLGPSLEIRGGLSFVTDPATFVPPAGTNGLFAQPVQVPGGLLGIDLPISLNQVTATAELAGSPSDIHLDSATFNVQLPLKLRLSNPLLGSNCHIGSNSNPVQLNLQTTQLGTPEAGNPGVILRGQVNADSTFAVPSATGCALGLGLFDALINLKLGLPSSSGNNSIVVTNDVGLAAA